MSSFVRYFLALLIAFSVKIWLFCESAQHVEGLYRSTDFEVHRGWMAITAQEEFPWLEPPVLSSNTTTPPPAYSPTGVFFGTLRYWYREDTSLWTMDYPMFFAYFEWFLAQVVRTPVVVDLFFGGNASEVGEALRIRRTDDSNKVRILDPSVSFVSQGIINFQRMTVLVFSDLPFFALLAYISWHGKASCSPLVVAWVALNPGMVIIDNIHFQYNGMLFAIYFLIIVLARQRRVVAASAVFLALVFFKHLFLYYLPGFAIWGLAALVINRSRLRLVIGVIAAAMLVALVGIGPFVASEAQYLHCLEQAAACSDNKSASSISIFFDTVVHSNFGTLKNAISGTIEPIKQRLFPFGRGLCHAYWAPNFFALYSALDLALCWTSRRGGMVGNVLSLVGNPQWCGKTSVNTRGLVGLTDAHVSNAPTHAILPHVTPAVSTISVVMCFAVLLSVLTVRVRRRCGSWRSICKWLSSSHGLLALCFCSSVSFFMFSWHVHEKALLTVLLPLAVAALEPSSGIIKQGISSVRGVFFADYAIFVCLTLPSLLPLLHTPRENQIKYLLYLFTVLSFVLVLCPKHFGVTRKIFVLVLCGSFTLLSVLIDRNPDVFMYLMMMSCSQAVVIIYIISQTLQHFPIKPDRKDS